MVQMLAAGNIRPRTCPSYPRELLVTYRGDRGKAYSESITLDVKTITHTSYATSSTSFPGRMESIAKSLAAVEKHLRSIASRK